MGSLNSLHNCSIRSFAPFEATLLVLIAHPQQAAMLWMGVSGVVLAAIGTIWDTVSKGDDLGLAMYVFGLGLAVSAINQMISTARADAQHEYESKRDAKMKQLLTEIRDRVER